MPEAIEKCKVRNQDETYLLLEMCNSGIDHPNLVFNALQRKSKESNLPMRDLWEAMHRLAN